MFTIFLEAWAAVATVCAVYFYCCWRTAVRVGHHIFCYMRMRMGYSKQKLEAELIDFAKELGGAN
jgi:hypothetical protein